VNSKENSSKRKRFSKQDIKAERKAELEKSKQKEMEGQSLPTVNPVEPALDAVKEIVVSAMKEARSKQAETK
jgi:hypothetical protein